MSAMDRPFYRDASVLVTQDPKDQTSIIFIMTKHGVLVAITKEVLQTLTPDAMEKVVAAMKPCEAKTELEKLWDEMKKLKESA
jgi:hypothetical protein